MSVDWSRIMASQFDVSKLIPNLVTPVESLKIVNGISKLIQGYQIETMPSPAQMDKVFEAVSSSLDAYGLLDPMENIRKVAGGLADTVNSFNLSVNSILESGSLQYKIGQLFESLPDLSILQRLRLELEQKGKAALDAEDFGYTNYLWDVSFLAGFANVDPNLRAVTVVNKLLAHTRGSVFTAELERLYEGSKVLSGRGKIVSRALIAHQERNYLLSIPTLLAQLEGTLGDAMIVKNLAKPVGGKLFKLDANGKVKLDKKGKAMAFSGVGAIIDAKGFNHQIIADLALAASNRLVSERNAVLHGRKTNYGKAGTSLRALIALYVMTKEVLAFEQGQIPRL